MEKQIYLIFSQENGYYKIGISKNPQKRIEQLQTGNSSELKIIETYKSEYYNKIEKALHRRFSHARINGEWFALDAVEMNNFKNYCESIEKNIVLLENNKNFT